MGDTQFFAFCFPFLFSRGGAQRAPQHISWRTKTRDMVGHLDPNGMCHLVLAPSHLLALLLFGTAVRCVQFFKLREHRAAGHRVE